MVELTYEFVSVFVGNAMSGFQFFQDLLVEPGSEDSLEEKYMGKVKDLTLLLLLLLRQTRKSLETNNPISDYLVSALA